MGCSTHCRSRGLGAGTARSWTAVGVSIFLLGSGTSALARDGETVSPGTPAVSGATKPGARAKAGAPEAPSGRQPNSPPNPAPLRKGKPERKPIDLGRVVVVGDRDRPGTGPQDAVAFATVLRLSEYRDRSLALPDLLRHVVGVDVRGFGALGRFATVSIRGSSSEQVQVFLDGVLLNRAASGILNLADIPMAQLERVEVYRGLTPARFGAAAPGGVINLVSRGGTERPRTTFSAGLGSFQTFDFNLSHGGPHRWGTFLVTAHAHRSEGNFFFLDNNGTPLNPTDDETVRRRNNAFAGGGGLLRTSFRLPGGGLLMATVEGLGRTQGVPGIDALQSERAKLDTRRVLAKLHYRQRGPFPGGTLDVAAFATHSRDDFRDPGGETGLAPRRTATSALSPGFSVRLGAVPSAAHVLHLLAEYRHDRADSAGLALGRSTETRLRRHALAFSLEDEIRLWSDRLVLNPSLRFDGLFSSSAGGTDLDSTQMRFAGKVGLRWMLAPGLSLRGNGGRFFRVPTLTELFGDTGVIRGNPTLKPEVGYTYDVGLTFGRRGTGLVRRVFVEAAYFESHVDDLIVFLLNGQGLAVAQNQAAAVIRGVELSAALTLGFGLGLSGSYTWQRARSDSADSSHGKLLPGRPQHKLATRVRISRGRWRVFYELIYIDGNFVDRLNLVALDARVLQAAGLAWQVLPQLTLSAEAQNLGDNRVVDLYRFPLPGRSFFARFTAEF